MLLGRGVKRLTGYAVTLTALLAILPACIDDPTADDGQEEDLDGDGKADSGTPTVSKDNLNGLWTTTVAGKKLPNDTVIESWSAIGIRLHVGDKTYQLTRTTNKLAADGVALDIKPNGPGPKDDTIEGKVDGKTFKLARDTKPKPTMTLQLPKDRPYRQFLTDILMPAAQADRESYVTIDSDKLQAWMESTVLYKAGSFQRKYMKGGSRAEQDATMATLIASLDGLSTTPRSIISDVRFSKAVKDSLRDSSLTGLALTNFNLYFTTGAGRSLHIPITDKAFAYFITDRPARAEKLGLVVMDTPSHGPLASTFGRQLLDLGAMPANDNQTYAKSMLELLVKSDPRSAASLSGVGQSALVDWFAVMAIEDYRGVAFGDANLGWGYNITNAQFYGLITRLLGGQVIVGSQLRPGDASYADVLNSGNDLQEYPDMARLKRLASDYLKAKHPELVTAVETAFATVVPKTEVDARATADIFHYICAELYDEDGRTATLIGAKADAAVRAVTALFAALETEHAAFEAYILAHGITKSSTPAPKSTGF